MTETDELIVGDRFEYHWNNQDIAFTVTKITDTHVHFEYDDHYRSSINVHYKYRGKEKRVGKKFLREWLKKYRNWGVIEGEDR